MNKIFNAEKTWAILFTENVKAGFDFGKDLGNDVGICCGK
jgi:hypothetical protein